jgi:hypothetical protein
VFFGASFFFFAADVAGSPPLTVAAIAEPPRATQSDRIATIRAGEGRLGRHDFIG